MCDTDYTGKGRGWVFFRGGGGGGGCNFYKIKLKSKIINDEKVNKQKCFPLF